MPILTRWTDVPETVASADVTRRAIEGAGAALVRVAVAAGTRAERHTHSFEQFVQVLAGAGILETAEGTQHFSADDVFHFPPETWHAATFLTDAVLVETNFRTGAPG